MIGGLAAVFHFQPSELWAMEVEEILFWHDQARKLMKSRGT